MTNGVHCLQCCIRSSPFFKFIFLHFQSKYLFPGSPVTMTLVCLTLWSPIFFNFYINSFDFVYLLAGQGQRNVTNSYRAGFHHLCSLIQCIFTNFWKVCKFLLYPLLNMLQIQEPPNTPRSFHPVPFGCEWFA